MDALMMMKGDLEKRMGRRRRRRRSLKQQRLSDGTCLTRW
jgi:hypothetical protein